MLMVSVWKRGVNPKFIRENELGYAPNSWNDLYDYLIAKGFEKRGYNFSRSCKKREKKEYTMLLETE